MSQHPFSSALELAGAIRTGAVSSVEAVTHFKTRIERLNSPLNAVVVTDFERALDAAAAADRVLADGTAPGLLHGVPLTVKEALSVAGLPTTSGAPDLRNHVPEQDATAVARLRAAGAIIMGKTNLSTYCGDWQSSNRLYGTTNNPWDVNRTAGGSSGGAAAAVAAGLTPLEVGSDIGGSIRIPANYCGVYGHKPTFGLVPMRGHIPGPPGMARTPDLAVIGPLASTPADLRLGLDVLSGPAGADAAAYTLTLPPARAIMLKQLRVAVWFEDDACPLDDAVGAHFERLIPALERAGAAVRVGPPPGLSLDRVKTLFEPLLGAEIGAGISRSVYERMRSAPEGERLPADKNPDPGRTAAYLDGMVMGHRQWLAVRERAARVAESLEGFFREVDVLITPVGPVTAFPHDLETPFYARTLTVNGQERHYLDHLPWVGLATMAGLPATVAPLGLGDDGLPSGAQIVGPAFGDYTTIAAAKALEEITGGRPVPPGFE